MEKSLEKRLKEACKQKFGISFKEMERFTLNDDLHLIVDIGTSIYQQKASVSSVQIITDPYGSLWIRMDPHGSEWIHTDP